MSASVEQRGGVGRLIAWLRACCGVKQTAAAPVPGSIAPNSTPSASANTPEILPPVVAEAPSVAVATAGPTQDFLFAARIAAVTKLNPPSSRSMKRAKTAAPAGKHIPKQVPRQLKPRPVAPVNTMARSKAHHAQVADNRPSAIVIDLAAAKCSRRGKPHTRAA